MSCIRNMEIERTTLGMEDHGIMTFNLQLRGNAIGTGFGGYGLDNPPKYAAINKEHPDGWTYRIGEACGMDLIMQILNTLGVDKWEHLKGSVLRVKFEHEHLSAKILAIGHIIENRWLDMDEFWTWWLGDDYKKGGSDD